MTNDTQNDREIRQYLLGHLADEAAVERLDERLFGDDEFAEYVAVVEDDLIDDFVRGDLSATDSSALRDRAKSNEMLRQKIAVCSALHERASATKLSPEVSRPSIFDSITSFFKQPIVAGAFAFGVILIVASVVFWRSPNADELADLKSIYKNERPTQARISDFEYAPLVTRRGSAEEREAARLRRIELSLLEQTESHPSAVAFHNLGQFYLTQQRFADATKALERALTFDGRNVAILNDLGAVYFERSRTEAQAERFRSLTMALDKFAFAVEISPDDRIAAFNKAQCLQELGVSNEAGIAWQRYLELDSTSGWADEARKAIERLKQTGVVKTKEQAVDDLFAAVSSGDTEQVWRIQSQTRDMMTGLWLPGQLIRRYVASRARGDDIDAARSIGALITIGELERSRNADRFVSELASFYEGAAQRSQFEAADALMSEGFNLLNAKKTELAREKFIGSRDLFAASGDSWMSLMAELWLAHALSDLSKLDESDRILTRLTDECEKRKFVWLSLHVEDWIANNDLLRGEVGRAMSKIAAILKRSETTGDLSLINRSHSLLAARYLDLGETRRSLSHIGRVSFGSTYGDDSTRKWRRNSTASDSLAILDQPRAAEIFARESLTNALSGRLRYSQAVDDSFRDLISTSVGKGDLAGALTYANEARDRANSTEDPALRARLIRLATSSLASLKRETGEYEGALAAYDEVLALQSADPSQQYDLFEVNKGRTLTLFALGRDAEEQLNRTLRISEDFRSRIMDADSRIAFLNSERALSYEMVSYELKKGDLYRAFELVESSRARSLLDFVGGEASVDQIEARFPTVSSVSGANEIRSLLPKNVQLVEYSVFRDRLAIWLLTSERFEYVESSISEGSLNSNVERLLDVTVRRIGSQSEVREASEGLYHALIKPIEPFLDKEKQLVVVPDGSLNKLPFAMLMNSSGRHLIEDYSLTYAPSATLFVRMTQVAGRRETANERLLSVGDPLLDRAENPTLEALPSAAAEARNVSTLYPRSTTLIGADATKHRFIEQLRSANVIHFAGHYVANESSPANSRLVLAAGKDSSDLRLDELTKLKVDRSMLIILSACDTNSENIVAGEGSTGIAQKFIAIGAPLVIAGNWKVDSESTSSLMQTFHINRRIKKLSTAEALRQAQISAMNIEDPTKRSPYYWAAFSAIGAYTEY